VVGAAAPLRRRALHRRRAVHRRRTSRLTALRRVLAAALGMVLVGGAALAATSWLVGLSAGSSAESQAASVSNLTIAASASPAATNLLYPGSSGDVVMTITNPNPYPVTITGVDLPANTTYATGYTGSGFTGAIGGCAAATSDVSWSFATGTSGSVHALTTSLIVAASGTLTVTMTNDASMSLAAPAACESAYFSMPAFTGIVATGGTGTATTSPATDAWTS
jgi:hypothetical protein